MINIDGIEYRTAAQWEKKHRHVLKGQLKKGVERPWRSPNGNETMKFYSVEQTRPWAKKDVEAVNRRRRADAKAKRDAEECESDAYMAAWTKIPPEEPRSLRAWLARAARNHALALLERSAAQKRGCGEAEAVLDELAECVPAPGSVDENLDAQELAGAIDGFLRSQDARTRRVFVQRCFECAAVPDIARRNGMSEQAVRSLLHRTRSKLRAYLESEELI